MKGKRNFSSVNYRIGKSNMTCRVTLCNATGLPVQLFGLEVSTACLCVLAHTMLNEGWECFSFQENRQSLCRKEKGLCDVALTTQALSLYNYCYITTTI